MTEKIHEKTPLDFVALGVDLREVVCRSLLWLHISAFLPTVVITSNLQGSHETNGIPIYKVCVGV